MRCLVAHATHPDARLAARLASACLHAQWNGAAPTLGLVYLTDALALQADALLSELRTAWPGTDWCGAASVGVLADGAEYFDEPALALMVCDLPSQGFRLFSGRQPLRDIGSAQGLLVHADPALPDTNELLEELSLRARPARPFGGVAASRTVGVQLAGGAFTGGLSGVLLGEPAGVFLGLTQGCQGLAPARRVTRVEHNLVLELDGEPALPRLLGDLGLDPLLPRAALPQLRSTLLGLRHEPPAGVNHGRLDDGVRVRQLLGLDLNRQALALSEMALLGSELMPCQRHAEAARQDLLRMATALRDKAESAGQTPVGAIYISCAGRGGAHFGAPHAEARLLRRALGNLPTVGFFAGGEILGAQLYGYSGVLALLTSTSGTPS
jgi:small ligand-binding sensory domain FIST